MNLPSFPSLSSFCFGLRFTLNKAFTGRKDASIKLKITEWVWSSLLELENCSTSQKFIRGCDYVSPSRHSRIFLLVAATGCQKMIIFSLHIFTYKLLTDLWSVVSQNVLLSTVYPNYVVRNMYRLCTYICHSSLYHVRSWSE